MKYINQTIIGERGNCFAACVASILEISIDDIPSYYSDYSGSIAFNKFNKWLKEKFNMIYIEIRWTSNEISMPEAYCIITGKSPRLKNYDHCVVGYGKKIIFDPHPDKTGLLEISKNFRTYGFFIPVNPML